MPHIRNMLTFLFILWLLALLYVVLMLLYARGWRLQQTSVVPAGFVPRVAISVIIPARNEEQHIARCIESICANDYPADLVEIIVIDDHSTDRTFDIVVSFRQPNIRCLKLADYVSDRQLNSYKKKALETGIAHANGELIVTTDADCITPVHWLKLVAATLVRQQPVMIVAPVAFTCNGSIVELFQSIDFMTMQGITAAAHRLGLGNMSNGANLAFTKAAFHAVDGYKGVDHLASGDDYLLMMKIHKAFPGRIAYLKSEEAIVQTAPQPDWSSFMNQRVRWASKSGKYDDKKLTAILLLVYLFNLSFLALLLAGFYDNLFWVLAGGIGLIKIAVEIYFLLPVAIFFRKSKELLWFPLLQPIHIAYVISAGFLGFLGKYQWKGRTVK